MRNNWFAIKLPLKSSSWPLKFPSEFSYKAGNRDLCLTGRNTLERVRALFPGLLWLQAALALQARVGPGAGALQETRGIHFRGNEAS